MVNGKDSGGAMKLYIAASKHDAHYVGELWDHLIPMGFEPTHRWDQGVTREYAPGRTPRSDARVPALAAYSIARACREGVAEAQAFVIVLSGKESRGAWVELGIALARGIPVVVVGESRVSVFLAGFFAIPVTNPAYTANQLRIYFRGSA